MLKLNLSFEKLTGDIMFEDLNKLPNGVSDFAKLRKEQRIYVDKTDLIYKLTQNSSQPILFTRPRRFGKSLLVSTLKFLFTNQLELFTGLLIYIRSFTIVLSNQALQKIAHFLKSMELC